MSNLLTHALKEWAAVVLALEQGVHTVLLRKGGISEDTGNFNLDHSRFLLYPTFEHQKPQFLKPGHAHLYQSRSEASGL